MEGFRLRKIGVIFTRRLVHVTSTKNILKFSNIYDNVDAFETALQICCFCKQES